MVQRSPSYIKVAKRRFRCMVKVAIPHFGWEIRVGDLECALVERAGRDAFQIVPTDWDGALQAVGILFDDADLAPFIANWADSRWPRSRIEVQL